MRREYTDPGRFYIINAPYIFTTVWSVVKGWLDPVTTEKIQILGSSPVSELRKQIPLENLPSIIGGQCNCPGGCQLSDAGPWNTPEGEAIIQRVKEEKEKAKESYERGGDASPEAPNTASGAGAASVKDGAANDKDGGAVAAAGAGGAQHTRRPRFSPSLTSACCSSCPTSVRTTSHTRSRCAHASPTSRATAACGATASCATS